MSIRTLTQEDPIGLAGGLNLYGFAGGDPINFSDPFGLCQQGEDDDEKCSVAQQTVKAVSDFLSSVPGQAIQAGAQALGKFGELLTSLVPGARGASEALAGASFEGESLDAGGRAASTTQGAAEAAAAGAISIGFKAAHGARHLVGTGLTEKQVTTAIGNQVSSEVGRASATGSFWGRLQVGGLMIEYRGFTLRPGVINNIGTFYPMP